ncbi:DUF262 domain-containing protein [Actinomyces respiraculi]|uniref:DUF262 domain-containing protein n=1 Tax=Actinomyces respiraculi TaxID=2744574 RepID=UPI00141D8736|nr:DUF262 domain-containing protein [Actinomyces respiraculi]
MTWHAWVRPATLSRARCRAARTPGLSSARSIHGAAARDSLFPRADAYLRQAIAAWLAEPDGAEPDGAADSPGPDRGRTRADLERRATILRGVITKGLVLVTIRLDTKEDAQAIVETLNARGTPLTAMDLVKNFLLQGLDSHARSTEELYERYWSPFETPFWEEEIGVGRTMQVRSVAFLNWWLTARTRTDPRPRHLRRLQAPHPRH